MDDTWSVPLSTLVTVGAMLHQYGVKTVLELGTGKSTRHFSDMVESGILESVHSIEHLPEYAARAQGFAPWVTVHYYPLADGWYDIRGFDPGLKFDALFVDGPPGHLEKVDLARKPALERLESWLSPRALIFLDDINRPGEKAIAQEWQRMGCEPIGAIDRIAVLKGLK